MIANGLLINRAQIRVLRVQGIIISRTKFLFAVHKKWLPPSKELPSRQKAGSPLAS